MEEEVGTNKSRVAQLESNIKTLSDEIVKANEIIRKLQQDNKNIHAKVSALWIITSASFSSPMA